MKKIIYLLFFIILTLSACFTETTNSVIPQMHSGKNFPQMDFRDNNLSINYYGTINDFPASAHLTIIEGGQKIRTDIKSFDGNKTQEISYIKINDDIYIIDHQAKVKSMRKITENDFILFFYIPIEKFLRKSPKEEHLEILENASHLQQKCNHFRINTDTSHAEFHVWNNILLIMNTEMKWENELIKMNLEAISIEKINFPNDSLFKISLQ